LLLRNNSYLNPSPDATPQSGTAREISLQSIPMDSNQLVFVSSLTNPLKTNSLVWFEYLMNKKFIIDQSFIWIAFFSSKESIQNITKKVIKSDGIIYFS